MPLSASAIESMIRNTFPDAAIELTDLAGDNDHWRLTITSAQFASKSRIEQHKMVYAALGGKMGGELHALQVVTKTP